MSGKRGANGRSSELEEMEAGMAAVLVALVLGLIVLCLMGGFRAAQ